MRLITTSANRLATAPSGANAIQHNRRNPTGRTILPRTNPIENPGNNHANKEVEITKATNMGNTDAAPTSTNIPTSLRLIDVGTSICRAYETRIKN